MACGMTQSFGSTGLKPGHIGLTIIDFKPPEGIKPCVES